MIDTDPATLAMVLWHGRDAGDLRVEGGIDAVTRFLTLFRPAT